MKVTIIGYTENFAINPDVKIYKQGVLVGKVSRNEKTVIEVEGPCELQFKGSLRSAKCEVRTDQWIVLSFNRVTGRLSAMPTTAEDVMLTLNKTKGKDSTRILWTVIISSLFVIAGVVIKTVDFGDSTQYYYDSYTNDANNYSDNSSNYSESNGYSDNYSQYDDSYGYSNRREAKQFSSKQDVLLYLKNRSYKCEQNNATLSFRGGVIYLNGQPATYSVEVVEYAGTQAVIAASSPYGGRYAFVVDTEQCCLADNNDVYFDTSR